MDMENFAQWITGRNDPNYEYNYKKKIVDNDTRLNKKRYSDINESFRDTLSYEKTELFKNTQRAAQLLSKEWEITSGQLSAAMKNNYGLSDQDCNECLEQLSRSKDISVRVSPFTKEIKISKIK